MNGNLKNADLVALVKLALLKEAVKAPRGAGRNSSTKASMNLPDPEQAIAKLQKNTPVAQLKGQVEKNYPKFLDAEARGKALSHKYNNPNTREALFKGLTEDQAEAKYQKGLSKSMANTREQYKYQGANNSAAARYNANNTTQYGPSKGVPLSKTVNANARSVKGSANKLSQLRAPASKPAVAYDPTVVSRQSAVSDLGAATKNYEEGKKLQHAGHATMASRFDTDKAHLSRSQKSALKDIGQAQNKAGRSQRGIARAFADQGASDYAKTRGVAPGSGKAVTNLQGMQVNSKTAPKVRNAVDTLKASRQAASAPKPAALAVPAPKPAAPPTFTLPPPGTPSTAAKGASLLQRGADKWNSMGNYGKAGVIGAGIAGTAAAAYGAKKLYDRHKQRKQQQQQQQQQQYSQAPQVVKQAYFEGLAKQALLKKISGAWMDRFKQHASGAANVVSKSIPLGTKGSWTTAGVYNKET